MKDGFLQSSALSLLRKLLCVHLGVNGRRSGKFSGWCKLPLSRLNPLWELLCGPTPQDDEFPLRLLVHPKTRDQSHLPDVLHVEATGAGGRDLGYPERWDISIHSDPEGQHVYGPSLATVENTVVEPNGTGGTTTKQVTALGLSKATHEFLTWPSWRGGHPGGNLANTYSGVSI